MPNPLETFKKIKGKSWTELRARGEQSLSAYKDQIGLSGKLPSDEEFARTIDERALGGETPTAENLFAKFFEDAEYNFLPAFRQKEIVSEIFRQRFGEESAKHLIEKAERICEGRFDLLGYTNLNFGKDIDWHLEPVSGKRSPLKHWKQFEELDAEDTGDKKIVWELNRHQHFFTFGAAYWLTGDEHYAETFVAHLESWMKENPPGIGINWMSSLEVAFRAISWIWAFNFFKDSKNFTPEIFHKALKFLYLHGRHLEKYLSTYYSPNTHLTGEALGLYYLGTQTAFLKHAVRWREQGEKILFAELERQFLDDGVYFEQSTWYQRYTTDFYTHFLILETLNGGGADKESYEKLNYKLQSALDFLMFATRPDGTIPLIGDDDGGKILPHSDSVSNDFRAAFSTAAVLFERGDYKFAAGELRAETLWLLGAGGAHSFDNLKEEIPSKTSAAFQSGGYFVMRDGWERTDNYLLVDCGALGALSGGHGHADALAIDVATGGKTVLVDSGTYTYHESAELRDYFRSTKAHNTLTIDGKSSSEPGGKFSWKTKANAELKNWFSDIRFDFFEGSHDGYERLSEPATHSRSILFLKNDYWILRDFVKTNGKHEYDLNFHFKQGTNPVIKKAANDFCVSEPETNLRLFSFDGGASWRRGESPVSDFYGRKTSAPFLRFSSKGVGSQEFFTFILPNEQGADAPEVLETELTGGRAFVINYRGYRDLFVYTDGDRIVNTELFDTNFRFLWARLGAGDEMPEEFVLIGGNHLSIVGREIINYDKEIGFAAARRFGNNLNVRTPESVFSVSL